MLRTLAVYDRDRKVLVMMVIFAIGASALSVVCKQLIAYGVCSSG